MGWDKRYYKCYLKCMGFPVFSKLGFEKFKVSKIFAKFYYTKKYPKWFKAGGEYSKKLVPKLAKKISTIAWIWFSIENAHCIHKCSKCLE